MFVYFFLCHTWGQILIARIDFYLFLPPLSVQTWQSDMAIRKKIKKYICLLFLLPHLRTMFDRQYWVLAVIVTFNHSNLIIRCGNKKNKIYIFVYCGLFCVAFLPCGLFSLWSFSWQILNIVSGWERQFVKEREVEL